MHMYSIWEIEHKSSEVTDMSYNDKQQKLIEKHQNEWD